MPSLSPLSEGSLGHTSLSEGTETLVSLSEGTETITALSELTNTATTHLGYFPDTALYSAPYPFPSSTSYPGDTYSTPATGLALATLSEGTETLTPLSEA